VIYHFKPVINGLFDDCLSQLKPEWINFTQAFLCLLFKKGRYP
jgi:hypothetical protein